MTPTPVAITVKSIFAPAQIGEVPCVCCVKTGFAVTFTVAIAESKKTPHASVTVQVLLFPSFIKVAGTFNVLVFVPTFLVQSFHR